MRGHQYCRYRAWSNQVCTMAKFLASLSDELVSLVIAALNGYSPPMPMPTMTSDPRIREGELYGMIVYIPRMNLQKMICE